MKSNRSITIISLNTNLVARSWIPLPDRTTRDRLDRLIKHGSEDLPMPPGCFATLSLAHGCAQLLISRRGRQLLTAGLAWGNHDSADLWRWLLDFREARCCQQRNSKDTRMLPPPPCPWLATLYRPAVARLRLHEATALVVYQRHLIAHLSRQAARPV